MLTMRDLKQGNKFIKWDGRTGTLLMVNDCRARVKLDGIDSKIVAFEDPKNPERIISFEAEVGGATINIAPTTPINAIIGHVEIDEEDGRPHVRREESERKFPDEFVILHTDAGKHKAYIVIEFTGTYYQTTPISNQPRTGFDTRAEAQMFLDAMDENAKESERIKTKCTKGSRYQESQFCDCKETSDG